MSSLIRLPVIGANDDSARLVRWLKISGEYVRRGQPVCEVETTKAVAEVEAESDGYLVQIAAEDSTVKVGEPLAALTDMAGEDLAPILTPSQLPAQVSGRRWTRKAEILAARMHIDLEELARQHPELLIGEAELLSLSQKDRRPGKLEDQIERVMILGSAKGGGAALIVDALARVPGKRAVGILDRDPTLSAGTVLGIPVLGSTSEAVSLWRAGGYDSAVIAFNSKLAERAVLFEDLTSQGIRFTNVIDPTADVRLNVTMGVGNVILAYCHIGPFAALGDNNFLSTFTCVEHHCRLGNHCSFGPAVALSGRVRVGNKVKFGTQIGVEPDVKIGDEVTIASGCVLTRNVDSHQIVKARPNYSIRPTDLKKTMSG